MGSASLLTMTDKQTNREKDGQRVTKTERQKEKREGGEGGRKEREDE